jgi:hypothetical protein
MWKHRKREGHPWGGLAEWNIGKNDLKVFLFNTSIKKQLRK